MAWVATRKALLSKGAAAAGGAWSPLDLASLAAWWDFSDADTLFTDAGTTPVSADAQAIYQANDKSGSGYHVVQTTEAARPLYKTDILNTLSTAKFGGVTDDDYLSKLDINETLTAATVVAVSKYTVVVNNYTILPCVTGLNQYDYLSAWIVAEDDMWLYGSKVATFTAATVDVWYISVLTLAGGAQAFYRNGGTALCTSTAATINTVWNVARIGGRYKDDILSAIDGSYAEAMVFRSALSTADLNTLGGYLATKWDLSWTDIT